MRLAVEVAAGLGYDDVWTHANSGNVIFDATGSRASIERAMGEAMESAFGFEVTTFVRSAAELSAAMAVQPFDVAAGDTYFITFLKDPPSAATKRALEGASNDFDTLVVVGRDVHWLMHGKSLDTTVPKSTWDLVGARQSTSRNTNLLGKLVAKIGARHEAEHDR
jgi:uncharacterized protein (DUF1697 family)